MTGCFVQGCDCPGVQYHFDTEPMIITARPRASENIKHGPRLANEFGFTQVDDYTEASEDRPYEKVRVLVFRAENPNPAYAEWFIEGLKHYEMSVEVREDG